MTGRDLVWQPIPVQVRAMLEQARRRGLSFDQAWPQVVRIALAGRGPERQQWLDALTETREAWRGAFNRDPAPARERALAAITPDAPPTAPRGQVIGVDRMGAAVVIVEPEPDVDTGRICGFCEGPIPGDRDPKAIYCSSKCKRAFHIALERERGRSHSRRADGRNRTAA